MPDKSESSTDIKITTETPDQPLNWPGAVERIAQAAALILCVYFITTCTIKVNTSEPNANTSDSRKNSQEAAVPVEGR